MELDIGGNIGHVFTIVGYADGVGQEFAVAFQYTEGNSDDGFCELYFTTSMPVANIMVDILYPYEYNHYTKH